MTLLLVDDDSISIDILAEYIAPHLPNIDEIVCAYDGTEAYDIIISTKPRFIVTDIKMPHLSGIDLLKKIQTMKDYHPKVIIVSGYNDFEYARDALKLHVDDYLLKPVDQDELIEKINTFLQNESFVEEVSDDNIIERVQKYISEHLDQSLRLIDIAEHFHYNASYIGRTIKKETGSSFNDYLLKLRVIKAQSLLISTQDSIKKISSDVGFNDPEHFTKRFKKVTKVTPSKYRKEHR